MSEAAHTPQLRFPEFNGAWEEKKLGEVVRYTKGFAFKSKDYVDSGVRIIRVSDLGAESIKKDNKSIYLSSENEHLYDKWKIRKNNIVITTVGSNPDLIQSAVGRGIFIINDNEGLLNQNMLKLENNTQVNNKFVHCFINSPKYIHHIKAIKRGNANQANITVKELLDFKLSITTKPEQQKIANFLTAVDNKIEQLSKKQALLGEYKKGLMQQIFSQAIRFKADDGSELPDWEEKKLDDVGSFKSGTGFTEAEQGGKSGVPFFKVSDMNLEGNQKVMVSANNYVNDEQIARLNYKPINKKSVIFAKVGAAVFLERKRIADSFLIDNNMMAFTPTEDIDFIRQWFDTVRLSKYAQVGALPSYNASDLKTIKINLPSLPEQTKVASSLSSIDNKIEQVGKQLDESKQFKKALLQQMFV